VQAYLIVDQSAFLCLITCTLCERTFFGYAKQFYWRLCPKKRPQPRAPTIDSFKLTELPSIRGESIPEELISKAPLLIKEAGAESSSEEEDFEGGANQVEEKKDDIDVVDVNKFRKLLGEDEAAKDGFMLVD
jgi:hypothetical protein